MNGWLKGEYIAAGIEQAGAGARAAAAGQAHLDDVQRLVAARDQALTTNAANFAEKHALRAALAKIDPKHPLLTNKALQEKIQNAGEITLALTNHNWAAVAEAGQTFKY